MRLFWKTTTLLLALALVSGAVYLYDRAEYAGADWTGGYPDSLAARNAGLRQENERLRHGNVRLPETREQLRKLVDDARELAGRFPDADDAEALAEEIRRRAEATGIRARRVRFHAATVPPEEDGPAFRAWRYSLFVQGSFRQIVDFIERLEENRDENWPYFEITDLNIGGAADPRNCSLAVFTYLPDEKMIPDIIPLSVENPSPSP